jgi:outer membrane protein
MKTATLLTVLFLSFACASCKTQETKADAEPCARLAILATRDVLTRCDAGAREVGEIQSLFTDRRIQLGLLEQDIRKLQEETQDEQAKEAKFDLLRDKLRQFAEEERRLRQDVAKEETARFKPILEKVYQVVDEYSKSKNIGAIQERGSFVYYNKALDITDEIVKQVNLAIASAKDVDRFK